MNIELFESESRGSADYGWLKTKYSFSFADYYDPERMGFGKLRVLNDDVIAGGSGFPSHPHKDMEIVTIVTQGALAHKDNSGGSGVIKPGEVQAMSAGSGIIHSEFNASKTEEAKLFQLWIETKQKGIKPQYNQAAYELKENDFTVIAGFSEGLKINQDAKVCLGKFNKQTTTTLSLKEGEGVFVFVIEGEAVVEGKTLNKRDAVGVSQTSKVSFSASNAFVLAVIVPL
ncbi:pirin family protein [Candidatus Micrarchaeota archaeon]|nr:pirin family protein [Candidatus Micrarchaeota archaeon]